MITASEELRLKLREKVLEDTFLFNKVVMGYSDIDIDPHYGMREFIDNSEWNRRMMLAPRGTIKSWNVRGWEIQQAMRDPNIRILHVMSTDDVAKSASRHIDSVFRNNQMLRWLFPDRIPQSMSGEGSVWNFTHKLIPRDSDAGEPTFTFCGVGAGQTGNHYDIIIFDDVVEEEAAQSETVMNSTIEYFSSSEPLLDELNPKAQVLVVGTRWSLVDLYSVIMGSRKQYTDQKVFRAEGNPQYVCYKRAASEGDHFFWPRKFDAEKLAAKQAALEAQGAAGRYYLWYQNNPVDESLTEFPRPAIRYWQWDSNGEKMILKLPEKEVILNPKTLRYTMTVDPAFEIGSQFDESAICIIGSHPRGYRVLTYAWTGQVKVHLLKNRIVNLCKKFHEMGHPIAKVGIEKIGGQRTLIPWVKEDGKRLGLHIPMEENLKRVNAGAKDNHIRGFVNVVAGGWYYTSRNFLGPNEEMFSFPNGKKNFLDALAYQPQIWSATDEEYYDKPYEDKEWHLDEYDEPEDAEEGYGGGYG